MKRAVSIPVTVKHRIGVDELDRYEDMATFVRLVAQAGTDRFIVHARKAWLEGLSPKANRSIPPLRYGDVYRLKQAFPQLFIELNGGIPDLETAQLQLAQVDGVMLGRAAYENPYLFALADSLFFDRAARVPSRREAIQAMLPYIEAQLQKGLPLQAISRHMHNLIVSKPGAKAYRRYLSENAHRTGAGPEVVLEALRFVPDQVLDERPLARLHKPLEGIGAP
jgi:tRNA-dihydrouridine synthase A